MLDEEVDDIFLNKEDQDWITEDINKKENKMENTYNKVQYSEFTPDRVGQWVLRGDTIEEVLAMKKELFGIAKPLTPAETPKVAPTPSYTQPVAPASDDLTAVCPIHNKQMKQRFYKDGNPAGWDHRMKNEKGEWMQCAGKGWK